MNAYSFQTVASIGYFQKYNQTVVQCIIVPALSISIEIYNVLYATLRTSLFKCMILITNCRFCFLFAQDVICFHL